MISILGKIIPAVLKGLKWIGTTLFKAGKVIGPKIMKVGSVAKTLGTKASAAAIKLGASAKTASIIGKAIPVMYATAISSGAEAVNNKLATKHIKSETGRNLLRYGLVEPVKAIAWISII